MALTEKQLLKELVDKVKGPGLNKQQAKSVVRHNIALKDGRSDHFESRDHFFKHLEKNQHKFDMAGQELKQYFKQQRQLPVKYVEPKVPDVQRSNNLGKRGTMENVAEQDSRRRRLPEGVDWINALFIFIAILFWFVDRPDSNLIARIPGVGAIINSIFGSTYDGFEFSALLNADWLGLIFSGAFLSILIFIGLRQGLTNRGFAFTLILIALLAVMSRHSLGNLTTISGAAGLVMNSSVLVLIVAAFVVLRFVPSVKENINESLYYYLSAIIFAFFFVNNSWMQSANTFLFLAKSLWHFAIIVLLGFLVIREDESQKITWPLTMAILLLIDFFGYSFISNYLKELLPFVIAIPILTLLILGCLIAFRRSPTATILFILIFIMIIIQAVTADATPKTDLREVDSKGKGAITSIGDTYRDLFQKWITKQIQYAITGKVEENQYEQLGVYLEGIKSAQPKYYETDDVVIWGTVKARTLDDPIGIKIACYIKDSKAAGGKIFATKIDPDKRFPVFTLEEQDFACTFDKNTIKTTSTRSITTAASFNFETLAFLKTYFMDQERLRAMQREGQDPFTEFNIKDKNPIAIYTNGPAEIGMKTTSSLIGVSQSYIAFPRIELSIQNRKGWEGKITTLSELVIMFPKGAGISDPEKDCNVKFKPYDLDQCKTKSCGEVLNQCQQMCEGFSDTSQQESCKARCSDINENRCKADCDFLFEEQEQKYVGFAVDVADLTFKNDDYERFKFFTCKFNPNPTEILDSSPITTKSIRVKARYNYTVEKSTSFTVQKDPIKSTTTTTVSSITGSTEAEKRIISLAQQGGFSNTELALAIAHVESGARHCKDNTITCGTSTRDQVITNGADYGIMQINQNAHPQAFQSGGAGKCFSDKTVYDLDCNVKYSLDLLHNLYITYGSNTQLYNQKVDQFCTDTTLNKKYKTYTGWDRAVRAYNGFGCTTGNNNYVEEVQAARAKVSLGQSTIKPPTDLLVFGSNGDISITWTKSQDDGSGSNLVTGYNVLRKDSATDNWKLIATKSKGSTNHVDDDVNIGTTTYDYYYRVEAFDSKGIKAVSEEKRFNYEEVSSPFG